MKEIKYLMKGISIEQFATPFKPESEKFAINLSIPIKTNFTEHTLAVGANVQFMENDKTFLIAEVFCHFLIDADCWNELSANETEDVVLPKGFINNLASIAVSTTRGVICAKTENTPFAPFFLPLFLINSKDGEDVIIAKTE